eukprot:COSAG03_NODE_1830_length_3461_cov_4.027365_1_plen_59_part_00
MGACASGKQFLGDREQPVDRAGGRRRCLASHVHVYPSAALPSPHVAPLPQVAAAPGAY